jgi:hydrogenase nickel incorporation protein HypA/HybF
VLAQRPSALDVDRRYARRRNCDPVHELSLCEAIRDKAFKHADGRSVKQINVRIGHLRQVVPDALLFGWEVITDATELKGTELVIEQIAAVVECTECGRETTLDMPILVCGTCGSFEVKLLSGEEFLVVSMELEDA